MSVQVELEQVNPNDNIKTLAESFRDLDEWWYRDTMYHSNSAIINRHPAREQILHMGEAAIPLILERIREEGAVASYASVLVELTGYNPYEYYNGMPQKLALQLWLDWGMANGHILDPVVLDFSKSDGKPSAEVVSLAQHLATVVHEYTVQPEYSFDPMENCVDFDLRLHNGWRVIANLFANGTVDASVFDTSGPATKELDRIEPDKPESYYDLLDLIRYGSLVL